MKEEFYVDLRKREIASEALKERLKNPLEPPVSKSMHYYSTDYCTDMDFPMRKCRPVVRRRTLAQVWDLIAPWRTYRKIKWKLRILINS